MAKKEKRRGRPPKYVMPEPIEGFSPEEIADVVLRAKPPRKWRYMEEAEKAKREQEAAND